MQHRYLEIAETMVLPGPDAALAGRLHMVDLAGSEDLRRSGSGSEEQRLAEARSINSSLCTLGKVVMQLTSDTGSTSHVPFRDSKLTRILKVSPTYQQHTFCVLQECMDSMCLQHTCNLSV